MTNIGAVSEEAQFYIDSSFYHPFYLAYYQPFQELLFNRGYKDLKTISDQLIVMDQLRPGYLEYKENRLFCIKEGLKLTDLKLDMNEIDELALQIFNKHQQIQSHFPIFAFMLKNEDFLRDHFKYSNFEYIENTLKKGRGLIISSHHWGAMEYALIGLVLKKIPITFVISNYVSEWFEDIIDCYLDDSYKENVAFIPINAEEFNNHVAYNIIKELKKNRVVFILSDYDVTGSNKNDTMFMGANIKLPIITSSLAIKSEAPIVHLYSLMDETDCIHINLSDVIETDLLKSEDALDLAKKSMQVMEEALRKNLEQWTYIDWFYKYMRIDASKLEREISNE